jgi:hypothetical protein
VPDVALPAEEAYRAAVAEINGTLRASNVEGAQAPLRSLLGNIPVFQDGRYLAARLTMNPAALLRNPDTVLLVGSGGPIWSDSRGVVCFSDALGLLRNALQTEPSIPDACGKGHPLTPQNLQMDDRGTLALPAVRSRARRRVSGTAKGGSVGNCPSAQGRWVRIGCPLAQRTKSRRFTRCAPLLRTAGMHRRATRCTRVRRNGTHWDSMHRAPAERLHETHGSVKNGPQDPLRSIGLARETKPLTQVSMCPDRARA